MRKIFTLTLILFTSLLACRKPFNPESIRGFPSALIVEGVINSAGATNIYLSRTLDLDDKVSVLPELKATVQVLSENNAAVALTERGSGLYSIPQLALNSAQKYRLRIKTASGAEYMSEPMAVRSTPPIDKFYWERTPTGAGIYLDTHDSQNKTTYYQWHFEEDWEIRSFDFAQFRSVPNTPASGVKVVSRDSQEIPLLFECFKNQRSTSIDIVSTAKLSSDVVSKHPIVFIPSTSDKLTFRYSINVKQHSLTFEAFEYLSLMKKNSEQLGSFFDSQPSELVGNIKNVNDPRDVAIGYIVIAPVVEKRIYITREEVPGWAFKLDCGTIEVKSHPDTLAVYFGPGSTYIPHYADIGMGGAAVKWYGTPALCLDCRTRGGGNVKPAFW